jgi:hypothetical protein
VAATRASGAAGAGEGQALTELLGAAQNGPLERGLVDNVPTIRRLFVSRWPTFNAY